MGHFVARTHTDRMRLLLLLALVAFTAVNAKLRSGPGEDIHHGLPHHGGYVVPAYQYVEKHSYNGKHFGKCTYDGLYYRDSWSYVVCSNGNSYVRYCAYGTENSPKHHYAGYGYAAHEFCNINLNDNAKHHKVEHKHHKAPEVYVAPTFVYRGVFGGWCGYDGLYYCSERSFIQCVAGKPHSQVCALGAANSDVESYKVGESYEVADFCNVNLIDGESELDESDPKTCIAKPVKLVKPVFHRPAYYAAPVFSHHLPLAHHYGYEEEKEGEDEEEK